MLNTLEDRLGVRVLDSLISETYHLSYVINSHQNVVGMNDIYEIARQDILARYDVSRDELEYLIEKGGGSKILPPL